MSTTSKIPIPLKDVGCQDLIRNKEVVHHGYLRRRGMLNNLAEKVNVRQLKLSKVFRWRQSYVVLLNGCIYIFSDETSARPIRATSLYGFTGIEPCGEDVVKGVSWPFKLVCALEDRDRAYFFSAPSEKDMKVWIECIDKQLLAIFNEFRSFERSVPTALVSPQSHGTRSNVASRPALPAPRKGILPEAEYVLQEDEEDDEGEDDYTEINEAEVDAIKKKADNFTSSSRPPAAPPDSKTQPVSRQLQPATTGRVPPTTQPPKLAPKPKVTNPFSGVKSASVDTGSQRGSSGLEDNVEYVGAVQYLELADDDANRQQSIKTGIPPEAYWNGKPDEADELMKTISHNGTYMLRDSSEKGAQTLIVRVDTSVVKYKIQVNEKGQIGLMAEGPHFGSMASLINFYKSNNVPRHNSPITKPYSLVRKA